MKRFKVLIIFLCMLGADLYSQSVGGTTNGATTYCSYSNSGFLGISGYVGNIVDWQWSTDGGVTWHTTANPFPNTLPNQGYYNLDSTTCYRAIVQLSGWPPDTSTVACITITQPTVPGTVSGGNSFCGTTGSGTLTLTGSVGNILNWQSSTDGGVTWTSIPNTTTTQTYSGITQTTIYEAVVQNTGPTCTPDSSTQDTVIVLTPSTGGTISLTTNDSICYLVNSGVANITGSIGSVTTWISSTDNGATWTPVANTTTSQSWSGLIADISYEAIVQNGTCPPDTSTRINIHVFPPPASVNAGPDTTIDAGQSVILNGLGTGTPFWLPVTGLSDPAVFNPVASPAGTTTYTLVVTDANGCLNADTMVVTVENAVFDGLASSYFSPNGDGVNDTWFIEDIQYFPSNEVFVYNIYGQQVYTKQGYNNDWKGTYNGSDLPDGTYYYVLRFTDSSTIVKGSVDILRKK
jgi:gliding motility-associated-like protein